MTESVKATLVIELNVECPECQHKFDILKQKSINSEGQILNELLDNLRWKRDADELIECCTHCPNCSVEFDVYGVNW